MPHILIVDDERSLRSMLALNFARAGYEVTMASDAFEPYHSASRNDRGLLGSIDAGRGMLLVRRTLSGQVGRYFT